MSAIFHPVEPGQNLVPEVGPIDLQRLRFPVAAVVPEDFIGHGLEKGFIGPSGRFALAPNCREKHYRATAGQGPADRCAAQPAPRSLPPYLEFDMAFYSTKPN